MRSLDDHLFGAGPRRILSLDGGGVRGLLTLGVLKRVETVLAARSPDPAKFRLSDYFDLIGGTSTGGIMATLLAFGKSVDEVTETYYAMCPQIFGRRSFLSRFYLHAKFDAARFRRVIDNVFDQILRENKREDLLAPDKRAQHPAIGTDLLRTGLAIFAKRIDKNSLWVFTNNPRSKYWHHESDHWQHVFANTGAKAFFPNRDYSLRAIIQATASAPFFLDPVDVQILPDEPPGVFLDGGVSHCNNPCLELFLMATLAAYEDSGNGKGVSPFGFGWKTGARDLYMLSIGTGTWREISSPRQLKRRPAILSAISALASIMADTDQNAVTVMQALSETPGAACEVNVNVGDMRNLRVVAEPLLTFKRVTPVLERTWLNERFRSLFKYKDGFLLRARAVDHPRRKNLEFLHLVGLASGERLVDDIDLPRGFDLPEWRRPAAAA